MPDPTNHREGRASNSQGKNLRAAGDRIEGLLQELGTVADPRVREKAEELVRLLMELYGSALVRVLEIVDDTGSADEIFDRLAADDLVASLLVLHGLHPLNIETRIVHALDRVRPYLGSHGGDVKLLGVKDGRSSLTLRGKLPRLPFIDGHHETGNREGNRRGRAGGGTDRSRGNEFSPYPPRCTETALLRRAISRPENPEISSGQWIALDKLPEFTAGNLAPTKLAGMSILVCRVGETFYAYQDSCPSCGSGLGGSVLQENILTCSACARRYDLCRAGQCLDMSELHLAPLPLLVEKDGMKIAVATEG